ncbi:MAG: SDR family oxidoreductase [Patescibacteria group bacterium]
MPQKLLITGGTGFIGKTLLKRLSENYPDLQIHNVSPNAVEGATNYVVQRSKRFDFSQLPNDFDYVVHTLALSSEKFCEDFDLAEEMNVAFTKDVLFFCSHQKKIQKFVHFSSIVLYDNDNDPPVSESAPLAPYYGNYSFTKGVAEEYVNFFSKKFSIPSVILRFSNLY